MPFDKNTKNNWRLGKQPGIPVSRRKFIFGGTILVLGAGVLVSTLFGQSTLRALVDTIIPKDEFGPAASETGAVEVVLAAMGGSIRKQLNLRWGLAWLNAKAGGSFASASESKRIMLVNEMSRRPENDRIGRFYQKVRAHTMLHYYGDATRANALGFVGPPQPGGYPEAAAMWNSHS